MTTNDNNNRVSKVNPFEKSDVPPSPSPESSEVIPLPTPLTLLYQQLTSQQQRVSDLESQLTKSQADHRSDIERLTREIGAKQAEIATLQERLKQQNEKSGE